MTSFSSRFAGPVLEVGLDLPYLWVSANHGTLEDDSGTAWFEDLAARPGYRLHGSVNLPEGFGARAHYFHFGTEGTDPDDFFNTDLLGAEGTANLNIDNWVLTA